MQLRILSALLVLGVPALAAGRELVFSDEFDRAATDTSKWNVVEAVGNAAQKIEGCYTPDGVRVADGSLHLVAAKRSFADRKTGRPCLYSSGRRIPVRVSLRARGIPCPAAARPLLLATAMGPHAPVQRTDYRRNR